MSDINSPGLRTANAQAPNHDVLDRVGRLPSFIAALAGIVLLGGCYSTYIPPSGRADLSAISSSTVQEGFAARPAAVFPASIAAVRVQAPRYRSYYTEQQGGVYGEGRYSVLTVKELGEEAGLERLAKLPELGGFVTLSRLLLSATLRSDHELREAAARLKADLLFLYTFDTTFHSRDFSTTLAVITLGLSPTRRVSVRVAASALVIDTRTGFIYAALEANEKREATTNGWESRETADRARQNAEQAAFKGLIDEFEKNWPRIIERAKKGA
jgi:hypothetical protein